MKRENGITLVALVITIIILIILAGISLTIVLGENGLIAKAHGGAESYKQAALEEQSLLDEVNVFLDGGKIELTEDAISKKVQIGDYVAYNPTKKDAAGTINVDASKLTYTSYSNTDKANTSGNGYGEQTFTATDSTKWRVLSIDEETGVVVLISDGTVLRSNGDVVYFDKYKGYLYAEKELNEMCKIFGYGYGANTNMVTKYQIGSEIDGFVEETITGSGARSINLNDVNKICGLTTEAQLRQIDNNYGTKPNATFSSPRIYCTTSTPNGRSTTGLSESQETYSIIEYNGSTYLNTSSILYDLIFKNTQPTNYYDRSMYYWLASRGVLIQSDDIYYCKEYVRK